VPGSLEAVIKRAVVVLALGLFGVLGLASTTAPARAAAGKWGAGQYTYLDGTVCTQGGAPGGSTVPYAAWDAGIGGRAYLMQPIASNGVADNGAPPLPSVGAPTVADVQPGMYGFGSPGDIAAFAAMLTRGGSAQAIAAAVYARFGQSVPGCTISDEGAAARAADLAGPYQVQLRPAQDKIEMGSQAAVTATVLGATGKPVPGLKVTFGSDAAQVGPTEVTTDGAGQASTSIEVPSGTAADRVSVNAQVTASVGLRVVTVQSTPSATNPSGRSVPAIAAAAPAPFQASTEVAVDTTAQPVLRAAADTRGVALGSNFAASAKVSGLRGHTAQAQFTIYGPLAPDANGDCSRARFSSATPVAARTDAVTVVGDRTFSASGWQPGKVGCYLTVAHLDTVDAQPNVSADSGLGDGSAIVTVIDVRGTFAVPTAVTGRDGLAATITPVRAEHRNVSAVATLVGPVRPKPDGSCDVDYDKAAKQDVGATTAATQDPGSPQTAATLQFKAPRVDRGGCYRWLPKLTVDVPGVGPVEVPVDGAGTAVLVLAPQITVATDQAWATTPDAATAHVTVVGAYGQPAHVTLGLRFVPTPPLGCRFADFAAATAGPQGSAVPLKAGQDSVVATTAALTEPGCYSPVAVLSLDADPSVTASSAVAQGNTIGAGVPLTNQTQPAGRRPAHEPESRSQTRAFVALGSLVGVQVLIAIVIGVQAWVRRGPRRRPPRPNSVLTVR
jgi:hypothetical protein